MNKDLKEHKILIKINGKEYAEKWQNELKQEVLKELNFNWYDRIDNIIDNVLDAIKNSNIPVIFLTEFYIKIALKELVKENKAEVACNNISYRKADYGNLQ